MIHVSDRKNYQHFRINCFIDNRKKTRDEKMPELLLLLLCG